MKIGRTEFCFLTTLLVVILCIIESNSFKNRRHKIRQKPRQKTGNKHIFGKKIRHKIHKKPNNHIRNNHHHHRQPHRKFFGSEFGKKRGMFDYETNIPKYDYKPQNEPPPYEYEEYGDYEEYNDSEEYPGYEQFSESYQSYPSGGTQNGGFPSFSSKIKNPPNLRNPTGRPCRENDYSNSDGNYGPPIESYQYPDGRVPFDQSRTDYGSGENYGSFDGGDSNYDPPTQFNPPHYNQYERNDYSSNDGNYGPSNSFQYPDGPVPFDQSGTDYESGGNFEPSYGGDITLQYNQYEGNDYSSNDGNYGPMDNFNYGVASPRLTNSEEANIHKYPYMVSIHFQKHYVCTGTIISRQEILTAATCVYERAAQWYEFQVQVGKNKSNLIHSNNEEYYGVKKIESMRKYNHDQRSYNVAILTLKTRIAVDMPYSDLRYFPAKDIVHSLPARLVAYGMLSMAHESPTILHQLDIQIIKNEKCQQNHSVGIVLHKTHFCSIALTRAHAGACYGDEGGAVLMWNQRNQRYVQVGLISYPFTCTDAKLLYDVSTMVEEKEIKMFIEKNSQGRVYPFESNITIDHNP